MNTLAQRTPRPTTMSRRPYYQGEDPVKAALMPLHPTHAAAVRRARHRFHLAILVSGLCLVLAIVAAEWRAIRPPPAEDTRIRSGMWLRRLVSILRWVTALGIVAIALMGGMLDML